MLRSPSLTTCYNVRHRHATHQSNTTVPAPQLSKDFEELMSVVANMSPTTMFVDGPDVANMGEFLVRYVVR